MKQNPKQYKTLINISGTLPVHMQKSPFKKEQVKISCPTIAFQEETK